MSFEDRFKDHIRRADGSIPGERLDWSSTITKARRSRLRFAAITAAAAVSVLGVGSWAVMELNNQTGPIGPASGPSNEPQPETTASAVESPFVERTCSATSLEGTHDHEMAEGLPPAVADVRMQIMDQAIACQYVYLEQLAVEGSQGFQYSYGSDGSPARFWADREREAQKNGEPTSEYMRYLVSVLQLPHCKETGPDGQVYYVWPRVHCSARTADDWDDLKGLYTNEQIDEMRTGNIYYGFRVGILENGDWVYFIAGD